VKLKTHLIPLGRSSQVAKDIALTGTCPPRLRLRLIDNSTASSHYAALMHAPRSASMQKNCTLLPNTSCGRALGQTTIRISHSISPTSLIISSPLPLPHLDHPRQTRLRPAQRPQHHPRRLSCRLRRSTQHLPGLRRRHLHISMPSNPAPKPTVPYVSSPDL
jgi:hypothetical protein